MAKKRIDQSRRHGAADSRFASKNAKQPAAPRTSVAPRRSPRAR
jgi:hypothetical protein